MEHDGIVIIGGGLAGAKAAEGARQAGFGGPIKIVCAEHHEPYERPPLTKEVLIGAAGIDVALVHTDSWFVDHDVDLLLGAEAIDIDLDRREVRLAGEHRLGFDRLILATGSTPRRPAIAGAQLPGVSTMRTIDDALALRERLVPGHRVAVVGASWVGTEVSACARQRGCDVVMVDPGTTPLERVLGTDVGATFARLHEQHGVAFRPGTKLVRVIGDDVATGVELDDGSRVEADSVVLGVGVTPNVVLAQRAGLPVDGGVLVDATLRTPHEAVLAAGDIASADHPTLGTRVRVEHWANALHQGLTAGANAAGAAITFDRIPYFFSDQYDMGMEYSGWPLDWDEVVVRGDLDAGAFVAFYLRGRRVIAGINVNVWDVNDYVQALIRSASAVDPLILTDRDVDPADWLTMAVAS